LSDEELNEIADSGGKDVDFTAWLRTLTETELLILRNGKPNANELKGKFNEYQKQNQKN
jgi:hypothetical protein